MIAWRNPAAFVGLLALTAPIVIHLLRRQRARRVPFPSLRFVRPVSSTAARVRRLADAGLLGVRLAILALAAVALAQPVLLTDARLASWNARTARAIVLDISESMRPHAAELHDRVEAESRGATEVFRVEAEDLRSGVTQAAARLDAAIPARREIIVISDLQAGALDARAIDGAPASAGIRFVQVGTLRRERRSDPSELMSGTRRETLLAGAATSVKLVAGLRQHEGLRLVVAEADAAAARRLLQVLEDAGTPAPSPAQPVVISFAGGQTLPTEAITESWMRKTVARLLHTPDLKGGPTVDVSRVVRAAAAGHELLIEVDAEPSSFEAAAIVRAALIARAGPIARSEEEVLRIPEADIAAWAREAPPVGPEIAREADVSDARWVWLAVLALLGVESWLRRSAPTANERGERANAA